jgi:hypothetical protein
VGSIQAEQTELAAGGQGGLTTRALLGHPSPDARDQLEARPGVLTLFQRGQRCGFECDGAGSPGWSDERGDADPRGERHDVPSVPLRPRLRAAPLKLVVRRLPVIKALDGEDAEAAARSPRQWVLLGALLLFVLFLPGSLLGLWLGGRLAHAVAQNTGYAPAFLALPVLVMLVASAWSAGAITGRFGVRTRRHHGAALGALGAVLVLTVALVLAAPAAIPARVFITIGLVLGLGALGAWFGAGYGIRRRP